MEKYLVKLTTTNGRNKSFTQEYKCDSFTLKTNQDGLVFEQEGEFPICFQGEAEVIKNEE